ncbi:MAG: hypothetical protein K6C97_12510 [Treponema sp.]|nr:hypothetical protein [Treponema sp.]
MAKMTSDLYYTQLSEINTFSVSDKRQEVLLEDYPDQNIFDSTKLSFYISIIKDKNSDKWTTIYHVYDKNKESEKTKSNQYDSFYKILMESKNTLKENLKNIIESDTYITTSPRQNLSNNSKTQQSAAINSTESLSGTWNGEENITKIVILRGGRGFIIFKNGASMNVSVSISNSESSEITIIQTGKANASFYPDLQRNVALTAALSADPIKWTLTLKDEDTLVGVKSTLLPDGDSFINGTINVEWKKIN